MKRRCEDNHNSYPNKEATDQRNYRRLIRTLSQHSNLDETDSFKLLQNADVNPRHYVSICTILSSHSCPKITEYWQIQVLTGESRYLERHKDKKDSTGNNIAHFTVFVGIEEVKKLRSIQFDLFTKVNMDYNLPAYFAVLARNCAVLQWLWDMDTETIKGKFGSNLDKLINTVFELSWLQGIRFFHHLLPEGIKLSSILKHNRNTELLCYLKNQKMFPPQVNTAAEAKKLFKAIRELDLEYDADFIDFGLREIPGFHKAYAFPKAGRYHNQTIVHWAAYYKEYDIFEKIVRKYNYMLDIKDDKGCTPVWYASQHGTQFLNYVYSMTRDQRHLDGVHFHIERGDDGGTSVSEEEPHLEIPQLLASLNSFLVKNFFVTKVSLSDATLVELAQYQERKEINNKPHYLSFLERNKNFAAQIKLLTGDLLNEDCMLSLGLTLDVLQIIQQTLANLYFTEQKSLGTYPLFSRSK